MSDEDKTSSQAETSEIHQDKILNYLNTVAIKIIINNSRKSEADVR